MARYTLEAHKGDEVLNTYHVKAPSVGIAQREAVKIAHAQGLVGHSIRATHVDGEPLPEEAPPKQREKFKRQVAPEPAAEPKAETVKAEGKVEAAKPAPAEAKKAKAVLVRAEKQPPAPPAPKAKKEAALPAGKKKKGAG